MGRSFGVPFTYLFELKHQLSRAAHFISNLATLLSELQILVVLFLLRFLVVPNPREPRPQASLLLLLQQEWHRRLLASSTADQQELNILSA